MLCRRFISIFSKRNYFNIYKKTFHTVDSNCSSQTDINKRLFKNQVLNLYTAKRFKHKNKEFSKQNEIDYEDKENDVWDPVEPYEKVIIKTVSSMRLDNIIKAGLGISRNKADIAFYESKIRLNAKKILKKSIEIQKGDEIDIIVGKCPVNDNCIIVDRIKMISVDFVPAGYKVKLVKDKSLAIEDYTDSEPSQ